MAILPRSNPRHEHIPGLHPRVQTLIDALRAERAALAMSRSSPVTIAPALPLRQRAIDAAIAFEMAERYEPALRLIDLVQEVVGETLTIDQVQFCDHHGETVAFVEIDHVTLTAAAATGKLIAGIPCARCDGRVRAIVASVVDLGQELRKRRLCAKCADWGQW